MITARLDQHERSKPPPSRAASLCASLPPSPTLPMPRLSSHGPSAPTSSPTSLTARRCYHTRTHRDRLAPFACSAFVHCRLFIHDQQQGAQTQCTPPCPSVLLGATRTFQRSADNTTTNANTMLGVPCRSITTPHATRSLIRTNERDQRCRLSEDSSLS